jgi:protein phosphatase 1L
VSYPASFFTKQGGCGGDGSHGTPLSHDGGGRPLWISSDARQFAQGFGTSPILTPNDDWGRVAGSSDGHGKTRSAAQLCTYQCQSLECLWWERLHGRSVRLGAGCVCVTRRGRAWPTRTCVSLFLVVCSTNRYAIEDLGAVQVEVSPVKPPKPQDGVEVSVGDKTKNKRLKMPLTWVGIFDGHGGDKASQFCADWLSSYVRNEESFPYDLGFAMKNAFTNIDTDFVATGHPDGSTACTATLVGGRRIVCANAGDSRAIVVRRDGSVVRLSRDHKPGMPDETRRISELGGRVIYWGRWRVEGLLAVSRSIGDASLKPYVCSDPEVCEYDIGKDDWFLVLSSDGVWDVMDNEECAHVIIASACVMEDGVLKIDTERFKWAARNLCEHAKSCGSSDNFSCVVVDLKSCGNPLSRNGRYKP